jgi:single-stranded-DNA-specific exonuclease
VLADLEAAHPGLILRFGGHAMAAGLSLAESAFDVFAQQFDAACRARLTPQQLERLIETDGPLEAHELVAETAVILERAGPFGQGIPEPVFEDVFEVRSARTVGSDQSHARYKLRLPNGPELTAVDFGGAPRLCASGRVRVAYALTLNRWQGSETLELRLSHLEPA